MTRSRRGARLVTAVAALLAALGLFASAADAQQTPSESLRGTVRANEVGSIEGVVVVVTTPDGDEIGSATTNERGQWEVALPGPGSYLVQLDETTLPEGVGLAEDAENPAEFEVSAGQRRPVTFSLGAGSAGNTGTGRFIDTTVNGIQFGLIIAMTAIGLSLIYGTTGLVNFAHGELVTFGAIAAWFLNSPAHFGGKWHILVAAPVAIVLGAALGGALDRGLWQPLRRRRTGLIQMLVISIGLMFLLRNLLQLWFGGRSQQYFDYNLQTNRIDLGPISVLPRDIWIFVISVVTLIAVATMLQRSRLGKAMRAVSDNRDLAESSGIDVKKVVLFVWVMGGGLAALGGVLTGLDENVSYLLGFRLLLLMFAGIILGGLGTAYGAMLGSLVVGLVTEWSTLFFSTELKITWALLVLIVILLVRPQGLLGRRERFG